MARNLVVCLDGTGAQPRAKGDSNVIKVFGMLDLTDPAKQAAYYDPGVGTFSAPGAWTPLGRAMTRLGGLAFGIGLRQNLGEAYTWLMKEWQPGDRIFLFGFSRGAYTARALSGMLRAIGLLYPGSENLVPYAVAEFARKAGEENIDWAAIHKFAGTFARKTVGRSTVPVAYLGAFDTVKAAGFLRWDIKWPYTRQLTNDARVRHAVSIDEQRRPFREYLVTPTDKSRLEEVWFAGVHTDVGGTFEDDPRLSAVSLKWIVEGAVEEGMIVDPDYYANVCSITADNARGLVHKNPWIYKIFIDRRRPIPLDAVVHSSVRARMEAPGRYAPSVTSSTRWADPEWTTLRPLPGQAAPVAAQPTKP
ncbi:MAG: hypothetical protein JWP70_620 [Leifsonia sp.]|nr:hypothetical protein [Leifsonia sp.]